jgi:hypothetical protein
MLHTAIPAAVENRIGEPMTFWSGYDFETFRLGLYVQTVQALAALGGATNVNCALRAFVTRNAYRTATPGDFLRALRPFSGAPSTSSRPAAHASEPADGR